MQKNYIIVFLFFLLSFNGSASLRPVAEEVQRMHNLNVAFYNHNLFFNVSPISDTLKTELRKGTQADINTRNLLSLVKRGAQTITVIIPFEGTTITVDLVRTNIFTEDFSVVTGENKVQTYSPGVYYRGIISGNPNSISTFSFFNNQLYGTISDDLHGNIIIGKLLSPGNTTGYVIYSDRDMIRPFQNFCNAIGQEPEEVTAARNARVLSPAATSKCVRIYYEIDNDLYGDNGNDVVATTNWITAVHNNIQTLYANDNINVAMSQVYVWSTADPYTGTNSTSQLHTFRATRLSFNGDVAQLVARDGNYGGLAYLDVLCTNSNYSYADIDFAYLTVPTYSWTVEVMTHEIGHNLGSSHTHSCGWPIGALDDCYTTEGGCPPGPTPVNGGTIMSYCHLGPTGINFNNGFGQYPRDTIIYAVNHATCLGASCAICITPAHDNCVSPATLGVSANCVYVAGNLCGATESIPPINCGGFTAAHGYDVWYKAIPGQTTMNVNCSSGISTDVVLAIYSGNCGSLSLLYCADSTGIGGQESIAAAVTAGTTYYIRVYDHNSNTTAIDFAICASQNCLGSTNNTCAISTPLTIGNTCSYINDDLCAATQSMSPSFCSGYTAQDAFDLWYSITPTQNTVRITAASGTNTDLSLGIYSGTCGSLNLIQCNDTSYAGGIEQFTLNLTPGNTYYLRVYDWDGNQYGTDFSICARYICSTPLAPTIATATMDTICAGDSTALTLTGTLSPFAHWHWYSGSCGGSAIDTGTSVIVSPLTTTTYYVRSENGACNSTCKNVTVTVIPIPVAPVSATANPSSLCAGSSTALSVTGTLLNGAGWYWYEDSCGGSVTGTGQTINISPTTSATYYVRSENASCYSTCTSVSISTTPLPSDANSITSVTDSVCAGDSLMLSVSGTLSPGASWHWYKIACGSTPAGSGDSISVSVLNTSTWYVRAENGICYSNCIPKTIYTYLSPGTPGMAGPSTAVCEGDSVTLTVTGTLGIGSDWYWYTDSCGGLFLGQGSSLPIMPNTSETYFVRAESPSCKSNCESTTITVNPIPPAPVINVTGSVLSVPVASAYQWFFSTDGFSYNPTATTQQLTATIDGYYFVRITDVFGCTGISDTIFYQTPNGVFENLPGDILSVYPNPFQNTLNVVVNDNEITEFSLKVYDAIGRLMIDNRHAFKTATFSTGDFAKGIYELMIIAGEKVITAKVVKQ